QDRRSMDGDTDLLSGGEAAGVALAPVGAGWAVVVDVGVDVDEHAGIWLSEAKTPSRERLPWRLATPQSILCLDAHAPATAPWTDAPSRTRVFATRPGGRETGGSQGGAAPATPQAAGVSRAGPAPPPP